MSDSFVTAWSLAHQAPLSMGFSRLEYVAISFSKRSSWPRDGIRVSCIAHKFFIAEPPKKPGFDLLGLHFAQTPELLVYTAGDSDVAYNWVRYSVRYNRDTSEIRLHNIGQHLSRFIMMPRCQECSAWGGSSTNTMLEENSPAVEVRRLPRRCLVLDNCCWFLTPWFIISQHDFQFK